MKFDIPQRVYGNPFMCFYFYFLLYFLLLITNVSVTLVVYCLLGLALSYLLASVDNRQNEKKDIGLYFVYLLSAALSLFVFVLIINLFAGKIVRVYRLYILYIPLICVIPSYFVIRIYQSIVNGKLERKYWEEYDRNHENK